MASHPAPNALGGDGAPRVHYVDWLRVIAVFCLIPFHTARIFDVWEANYAKSADTSLALSIAVIAFLNTWFMPLLFLLAGASTWFALRRRTAGQYAAERVRRLLVPLVFGILVVVPPQAYLARFQQPGYDGSYFAFLADYFGNIRGDLSGYTGLFTPGHLWFILFLLILSLVALPLFLYLRGAEDRRLAALARFWSRPAGLYLLVVPLIIAGALPEVGGKNPFYDLLLFIYGFVIAGQPAFREGIDRIRRPALFVAILTLAGVLYIDATGTPAPDSAGDILFWVLRNVNTWCTLLALLAYGARYLNFSTPLLSYAAQASYPFYILHQTVIIAIGYFLVAWPAPLFVRFLAIAVLSLLGTVLVYDMLVRRINVTRFLFGMKPLPRSPGESVRAAPEASR